MKALQGKVPDYEVASEHEHSNCVLLAHRKVTVFVNHMFDELDPSKFSGVPHAWFKFIFCCLI